MLQSAEKGGIMQREITREDFEAERSLYAAVIERAALDLAMDLSSPRHWVDKQQAEAWVMSSVIHETAFVTCCEIVGLDPDKTRAMLLAKTIKSRPVTPVTIQRRKRADKKRRQA